MGTGHDAPMAPRLPIPFLPAIARNTESMAEATQAIPDLRRDIQRVAEATAELGTIDARMRNIEAAMPVLVEVQQHLAQLPETMERLDGRIAELSVLLQRMLDSMNELTAGIDAMQEAVGPLGRLARRLPRSGRDQA
jgi:prefoldin subunit 5